MFKELFILFPKAGLLEEAVLKNYTPTKKQVRMPFTISAIFKKHFSHLL
jgi:hypothetical protein